MVLGLGALHLVRRDRDSITFDENEVGRKTTRGRLAVLPVDPDDELRRIRGAHLLLPEGLDCRANGETDEVREAGLGGRHEVYANGFGFCGVRCTNDRSLISHGFKTFPESCSC